MSSISNSAKFGVITCSATLLAWLAGCASATDEATEGGRPALEDTESARQALALADATELCEEDPRVVLGLVSLDVCVGAELFFRDDFGGNGRSCSSCHPVANNYTIDPPFIATLPASDPLFVNEQVAALAGLERSDLLRNFGLILENADGLQSPTTKFTMRSVPHTFSLGVSVTAPTAPITDGTTLPPLERTGWSGDGAPNDGELRDFQTGAVIQHYPKRLDRVAGVDFVLPTSDELDAIEEFSRTIGRTNEIDLTTVSLTDSGAQSGRATFTSSAARCNGCHRNAGANVSAGFNRNFDTGVERARLSILNTQGIPFDGGFGAGTTFNFDASGDGILDAFGNGGFNTPPLIEAADTGPFFHTNAFGTIEQAVAFYNSSAFNNSPAGTPNINLNATEVANVGRFLRVLNAAFNIQLAIKRIDGVLPIIAADENASRELQQELARLARVEAEDAFEVLDGVSNLNAAAKTSLTSALGFLQTAATHASHTQRGRAAEDARAALVSANTALGTGMGFTMGPGTLMF
jgi:cytochrome c peroxidase